MFLIITLPQQYYYFFIFLISFPLQKPFLLFKRRVFTEKEQSDVLKIENLVKVEATLLYHQVYTLF